MKSKWNVAIIIASFSTLALIVAAPVTLWRGPRPVCGRLIDGAIQQWWLQTQTNCSRNCPYPNVDGSESGSLPAIEPFIGAEVHEYGYVPGLNEDDPGDLVLMYMKTRTAYTWHGDSTHTILSPRHWMVLSPGTFPNGTCPEGGELLDTAEFKRRLERTLAFVKEHERPYWPKVLEEQSKFLKRLKD
jgi:hypothetical protein